MRPCVARKVVAIETESFQIEDVIRGQRIVTRWQPICSVKKKRVIGFEALSMGVGNDGSPIGAIELFAAAEQKRLTLELDRLCRTKAIESFSTLAEHDHDATLFVNLETSIFGRGIVGSGHLGRTSERVGLDPRQVVVEIVESRTDDLHALREFIETYRRHGFLIALDDVGAGHSNFDRIAQLKPDILKIDRNLATHLHEHHARAVFRALTNLAHATGALVVAEGMEQEHQALLSLELGADLLQGDYLAKPQALDNNLLAAVAEQMDRLTADFRDRVLRNNQAQSSLYSKYRNVRALVLNRVQTPPPHLFDAALAESIARLPTIEFAYVLSSTGIQITRTVGDRKPTTPARHFLFEPAEPGDDHSLKEYVLLLNAGRDECLTPPYISLATGKLCQTLATRFTNLDGSGYILCLDFAAAEC